VPTERPAATPNKVDSASASASRKAINTISGWAYDLPNRRTRWKSVDLVRRNLRFTPANRQPQILQRTNTRKHLKETQLFQLIFLTWLFMLTVK
jgi:hypothetical protein